MMGISDCENYVEEVNGLINQLDISGSDAIEIINIYFECYSDAWIYDEYLRDQIRVIKKTEENEMLLNELETIEDACLFEGDDYVLLTNYATLQNMGEIGDCLPNHSF